MWTSLSGCNGDCHSLHVQKQYLSQIGASLGVRDCWGDGAPFDRRWQTVLSSVLSWKQRDKISCSWLLALPGPDTQLTSAEFSEAAASNLCLPSPVCAGRVGEVIKGRVKIDQYGDNIQATNIPGDHWRGRKGVCGQSQGC